jgi:hypothetical protein
MLDPAAKGSDSYEVSAAFTVGDFRGGVHGT